jgi:ATP-dependent DNA ligase
MMEMASQWPAEVQSPDASILNLPKNSHKEDVWVEPELMAEIQYASITANDIYREPIFLKLLDHK